MLLKGAIILFFSRKDAKNAKNIHSKDGKTLSTEFPPNHPESLLELMNTKQFCHNDECAAAGGDRHQRLGEFYRKRRDAKTIYHQPIARVTNNR
jgi:hypothetical protein